MESTSTTRQSWMSVLAHSQPAELLAHWQPLNLSPTYQVIRAPEIGLNQLQARMGATGRRFILGDMTLTRAVIMLNGNPDIYGYSYIAGATNPTPNFVHCWMPCCNSRPSTEIRPPPTASPPD